MPDRKETPESFDRRLKTRGAEDTLLARTRDGEVVAITGAAEGTDGDKMKFRYRDKTRTLPLSQVEGLILAARPEARTAEAATPIFTISGGSVVSGKWKEIDSASWKIETPWGQTLSVPPADVQGVRLQGGKVTYLSDLTPSKVEETPFFGRKLGWRKDVNLVGEPLKLDGRPYDRGLSVHSRSALTYDLNGRFATFEALVGFDESARGKGRVDCRVYADGKEIYANPDFAAPDGHSCVAQAARRRGRTTQARHRLRPRPGHRRPRDLGQRPPLSPDPGGHRGRGLARDAEGPGGRLSPGTRRFVGWCQSLRGPPSCSRGRWRVSKAPATTLRNVASENPREFRTMRNLSPRTLRLPAHLGLCLLACATRADDKDKAQSTIEVNDWSI